MISLSGPRGEAWRNGKYVIDCIHSMLIVMCCGNEVSPDFQVEQLACIPSNPVQIRSIPDRITRTQECLCSFRLTTHHHSLQRAFN